MQNVMRYFLVKLDSSVAVIDIIYGSSNILRVPTDFLLPLVAMSLNYSHFANKEPNLQDIHSLTTETL